MAKFDFLPASVNRKRRILGRIISGKQLPQFVYRFDSRPPATIRRDGFQPRQDASNVTLMEHVNNCYAGTTQQTKFDSHWVSTGGYGLVQKIDPTFAQQLLDTYLYKIDTSRALATGNFHDANDAFDRAGVNRPYATQREWLKLGGVPQQAILWYMEGRTLLNQLSNKLVAPAENALNGWQQF